MGNIKDHLDHVDQLEVAWYGPKEDGVPLSVTVECTRCGCVVHELYDVGTDEEKYLRHLVSAQSRNDTTFALVQLSQDLVEELIDIHTQLMDLSGQGNNLQVSSFNVSRINEMCMAAGEIVCLKDYDEVGKQVKDWAWLHEEVIGEQPPDDFCLDVDDERWTRLTELPTMHTTETRCVVTRSGVYWEMDAPKGDDVALYITQFIPWGLLDEWLSECRIPYKPTERHSAEDRE